MLRVRKGAGSVLLWYIGLRSFSFCHGSMVMAIYFMRQACPACTPSLKRLLAWDHND